MNENYLGKKIAVRFTEGFNGYSEFIFSLDENMNLVESSTGHVPFCESGDLLEQICSWYPDAEIEVELFEDSETGEPLVELIEVPFELPEQLKPYWNEDKLKADL